MVAAFLGLRLYSVLGRRAEHEEEHVPNRFQPPGARAEEGGARSAPAPASDAPAKVEGASPAVERGIQAIYAVDRSFDLTGFMEGAKAAYEMILEAFWQGDRETLREFCADDVYASFDAAISTREAAGETLDNKLIRIEEASIRSADAEHGVARIAVLFVSDIAAVTRDSEGNVVAGSLDDAIESRDIWTFRRQPAGGSGPDWQLDETDEG
jgi:predicted lipid-binding transport protein (Tim44 family)